MKTIDITATGGVKHRVVDPDGGDVSEHSTEHVAKEAAVNLALARPGEIVRIVAENEFRVVAQVDAPEPEPEPDPGDGGVTEPDPEPEPEPDPDPEPEPEPTEPLPEPPAAERPEGAMFYDEPGEVQSGPQGSASWSVPSIVEVAPGMYAARARHSASPPGKDIGSGPTEKRFRFAEVDASTFTRVEFSRHLYIPQSHYHAFHGSGPIRMPDEAGLDHPYQSSNEAFVGLSFVEGEDVVRSETPVFHPSSKGLALAFPGAGLPGDDGLAAYLGEVISPTEARLTQMHSYKLDEGETSFSQPNDGTYTAGPLAGIPATVSGVVANKIHRSSNHKHCSIWGRAYSSKQMPHPFLVAERWPHRNYKEDLIAGDSVLTVKAYYFGPDGSQGAETVAVIPGVVDEGPGYRRGFWNHELWVMDIGDGPGTGSIIVDVNGERLVDAHDLPLWPTPYTDGREQLEPYPFLDAGYLDGWINGGFMEDSDHLTRNFALKWS